MTIKAWENGKEVKIETDYEHPFRVMIPSGTKVDYFTIFGSWEIDEHAAHRITGEYQLGSASAELYRESGAYHTNNYQWAQYRFQMKARLLEDAQRLYELIRAGKILPTVSYEEEQVDTPIRQFRDLVREFFHLVRIHIRSRFAAGS